MAFHDNCGTMIVLSNQKTRAERQNAITNYNNAVVMTNQPLVDDKLFEVCKVFCINENKFLRIVKAP